jgi:hypothetical protein
MRSTKLTVIAAAAATLALAPTGASAAGAHKRPKERKPANAVGHCRLSVFAEPHQITAGETVQVFGRLACLGSAATIPQPVTVYERTAGGSQVLGTATTGAGGYYSLLAPPVNADSRFYVSAAGARSAERIVKVAPQVTLKGPPENTQLFTGARGAVLFSGTVTPTDAGAQVILQREAATSSEEWHVIQRGRVSSNGEYAITHRFVVPGAANLRVIVRAQRRLSTRGISNTLFYDISQRENSKLTINTSADPISYGQTVTLSGTVAQGANQPVTLLARGRGASFAPAGTTTTNSKGEYTFVQMPAQSSFYRVTAAAGTSSTVLFEGVKYVLTAGVSGSSVQSGQALVFSGTVTPGQEGHPVYLERQNAAGNGYHVVDVGTVAKDSTYSISHHIYGSGKETFRVTVPGDPADMDVSSSPFAIEVTPSTASALKPVPPSQLPAEGQV